MPLQVQFNSGDTYDQVKAVEVDMPTIGSQDEVLVKFLLNPVNPSDILTIDGTTPIFKPDSSPATPGVRYKT
jgi:NADPH:quinone reductase-like Zn-dependent oxidoreductase